MTEEMAEERKLEEENTRIQHPYEMQSEKILGIAEIGRGGPKKPSGNTTYRWINMHRTRAGRTVRGASKDAELLLIQSERVNVFQQPVSNGANQVHRCQAANERTCA